MAIHETYSERKRQLEKGGTPDVYTYDEIPERLKVQSTCQTRT
jgi:hypothetical protein